ncbi:MAG: M23 family metallopeptidase, partial [Verrucomicrobiota bacterium]
MSFLFILIALTLPAQTDAVVKIEFPTENRELLEGKETDFFQPTISKRKISGKFGFVRTGGPEPPRYFERLHEGIDIKPLRRDANGEPLDPIVAVAPGTVVYVNAVAARSNYGIYVIVEHRFDDWPMYAFYSHMASVDVQEGEVVDTGQQVGILGYTGSGINKARAHLHFEMTFRVLEDFGRWFDQVGKP